MLLETLVTRSCFVTFLRLFDGSLKLKVPESSLIFDRFSSTPTENNLELFSREATLELALSVRSSVRPEY